MSWIGFFQGLTLLLLTGIGRSVWQMVRTLSQINEHLITLNGRISKIEQWQTMHEEHDVTRFRDLRERVQQP